MTERDPGDTFHLRAPQVTAEASAYAQEDRIHE